MRKEITRARKITTKNDLTKTEPKEIEAIAYREAGFAVPMAERWQVIGERFEQVSVVPGAASVGLICQVQREVLRNCLENLSLGEQSMVCERISVHFMGYLAEYKFRGWERPRLADLDAAGSLESLLKPSWPPLSEFSEPFTVFLDGMIDCAANELDDYWDEIQAVADALLERKTLTRKEVETIIREVQQRRPD